MKKLIFYFIRWVAEIYLEARLRSLIEIAGAAESHEDRRHFNYMGNQCQDLIIDIHKQRQDEKYKKLLARSVRRHPEIYKTP